MTKPFHIESQHIARLDEYQLTQLLKLLLHAEADKYGIAQRAVDVALNIKVGDGGEDGRIEWQGGPASTSYLPNRLTQFQNKATEMGPAACANELITKSGEIKPMVLSVLEQGGCYILFTTQELNKKKKNDRIKKMRAKLSEIKLTNAATVDIDIYDASKIAGWANNFLPAIVSVLYWIGSPLERGLKSFSVWKTASELEEYPYVEVDARKQIIIDFRDLLKNPRECARIVGLSGLGKTRMAFEIFKGDPLLQEHVVYMDAVNIPNIAALLSDWIGSKLKGIVVVDNCDAQIHEKLEKEIFRTDSQLSLLSLDYNLDTVSIKTKQFTLKPLSDSEIKTILEKIYAAKIPDLDRISKFAQGFPQMAVLIAEARLSDDPNIGSLTDDVIAERLLWSKSRPQNEKDEKILKGCALFDRFGVDKEASGEYKFIAKHVVEIDEKEFYDCVQRFTESGIIDRRDRYAQLVPKPLAIRLAAQWWRRTREQDQANIIDTLPETLVGSFCEQIEKLDFLPEVKELTESLCGRQAPFGQAEVILSIKGSRLFRSFVNLNPEVTTSAILRILQDQTHKQLLEISGEVRRNLVWALEMLCFHADLFEDAAWALLLLASAENESYANNAQGIFAQLYRAYGSGTAATPEKRIFVIKRAIECNDIYFTQPILKALEVATSTQVGWRTLGAEYQGTKAPLKEWQPKIWQEIFDYWQQCFDILILVIETDRHDSDYAKNIIGHSIRGLMQNGRIEMLDRAIKQVITLKGKYWPTALESIKVTLEFDANNMPSEGIEALNNWLVLLSPDQASLEEKLKILVVNPPREYRESTNGDFVDIAAEKAKDLANELSKNIDIIIEHLPLLLNGEQNQSFAFGRELAIIADDINEIFKTVVAILGSIERPNLSFALGLLNGVCQKSIDEWNNYLEYFLEKPALLKFYPEVICSGIIDSRHLNKLLGLIRNDQLTSLSTFRLSYGSVTNHLNSKDISDFCFDLAKVDSNGSWAALDILIMYCYGDESKFDATKNTLRLLVTSVSLNNKSRSGHFDLFHWKEVVCKLLKTEGLEFSNEVCKQIIAATDEDLDHSDIWHSIKPVLLEIMSRNGEELWPIFGKKILSAEPTKRYWLQSLFSRESSFSNNKVSVFSVLSLELVIIWCKENPDIAPYFVARAINIFDEKENGSKQPTRLFIELLENFGDLDSFGGTLSANLGSRGWSGSLVPYLESDKSALTPLLEHPNHNVRNWVRNHITYLDKQIDHESIRDDEHDLGIY